MLKKPQKIPASPGIYIFKKASAPIYVGKAANLRARVSQYFQNGNRIGPKTAAMLREATSIEFIETPSEIEALIREAEAVKRRRPKYNILLRDDKQYFYAGFTKEDFPKIFLSHQTPSAVRRGGKEFRAHYVGPFTGGEDLKRTLKLLRRVFPFCTCKKTHKRPCLNSEIGRCPGYCCTARYRSVRSGASFLKKIKRQKQEYRKNIQRIKGVLEGKKPRIMAELKRKLKEAAETEAYERAAAIRDQIQGLEAVFSHRPVLRSQKTSWPLLAAELQTLLKTKHAISRIEGYDISDISGHEATGSMVVFANGVPDKSQYRKFKIRTVAGPSDVDMHKEVFRRRFMHPEWPWPDLIVVDGGKPQLGAAMASMKESRIWNMESRPMVAALAKREEILFAENGRTIFLKRELPVLLHFFQRIRDESHRFAQAYHHKLREMSYRNS